MAAENSAALEKRLALHHPGAVAAVVAVCQHGRHPPTEAPAWSRRGSSALPVSRPRLLLGRLAARLAVPIDFNVPVTARLRATMQPASRILARELFHNFCSIGLVLIKPGW